MTHAWACIVHNDVDCGPINNLKPLYDDELLKTRVLMKIFKTNSKDVVIECKRYFGFRDVDELITQKKRAFLAAFNVNDICNVCKHVADRI